VTAQPFDQDAEPEPDAWSCPRCAWTGWDVHTWADTARHCSRCGHWSPIGGNLAPPRWLPPEGA
jgi:hypothetical protein